MRKEDKCVRLPAFLGAFLFMWYTLHSVKVRLIELVLSDTVVDDVKNLTNKTLFTRFSEQGS